MSDTNLYKLCKDWEKEALSQGREYQSFVSMLDEIEFQSEHRYRSYRPFNDTEGDFINRLTTWICQVDDPRFRQSMLEFVLSLIYIDERDMQSLYKDAYRRIIVPWIKTDFTLSDELSPHYTHKLRNTLIQYDIYSITESFIHKEFENANELCGLLKSQVIGERKKIIPSIIERSKNAKGLIILEDIVGSGYQAARVLKIVRENLGTEKPILFVPLIAFEKSLGPNGPLSALSSDIVIKPVSIIHSCNCVTSDPHPDENEIFKRIRSIVNATASRVMQRLDDLDDQPDCAFGYGGAGGVLVTYQNTPNNTLPLLHHKSPEWAPLFRRSHHSYERKK